MNYQQRTTIAWREIEGQAVLIDPGTGTVFVLNGVGSSVWEIIEQPHSIDEIKRSIGEEYDTERQLDPDIREFLETLEARKLVEVTG